jgi:hypothetical protein
LTWSLARIWPVKETVSPSACASAVTVRTGRGSGVRATFLLHPATEAAIRIKVAASITVQNRLAPWEAPAG